jgi:hypothetical protein
MSKMCNPVANNIITFNVSGVPIKISTEKLAKHPESLLTSMVHNKVQPAEGFFVECCPKIFGCILRFIIHEVQVDPVALSVKLSMSETQVRKVIDGFKFKGIYSTDTCLKVDKSKEEAQELYKSIWTIAENGDLEKLRLFAVHGFDLDVKSFLNGETPLMCATRSSQLNCVNFLVEHGVNVNTSDNDGLTPLHWAICNVSRDGICRDDMICDIIKVLIKHGVNVNTQSKLGNTPLHKAIEFNRVSVV